MGKCGREGERRDKSIFWDKGRGGDDTWRTTAI